MAKLQKQPNQLRIIGGDWRSRKIPFVAEAGVRPTADRVRETVFNWLQYNIHGAHCLDLFAGSGAFSFEALSRGATAATLIDEDIRIVQMLKQNAALLDTDKANCIWSDALAFLSTTASTPFDVVFVDPPYRDDILGQCCQLLEQHGWLSEAAIIYLEHDSHQSLPSLPDNWQITHEKKAGKIAYHLAVRNNN